MAPPTDAAGALNRFGYEWSRFSKILPLHEEQFLRWIYPLGPADFRGKRVLDAGCGTGRNSYWALKYGADRVTAFDVDPRTVAAARRNLGWAPNAEVFAASIYDISFRDEFDIAFSIGVIHHLPDPRRAVARLVDAVRPGGTVLIWVYGKEGYTWVKSLVERLRPYTCKIPPRMLEILVAPFSALFFAYVKSWPHRHPYLKMMRRATFGHLHSIVFDQLLPEVAHYWTRAEALSLFEGLAVANVTAHACNAVSHTVVAQKAAL